jgi:hypothetical protein
MPESTSVHTSWRELLCAPPPAAHVLQLYDNDPFLTRAVAHFAAEGLRNGEAVLLTGTPAHAEAIRAELDAAGVDRAAALRNGQLVERDVHEQIARVMKGRSLDADRFRSASASAMEPLFADARFSGVRWWGEMTTTLAAHGEREAGLAAERLADDAAKRYGVRVLCSCPCDRYDAHAYGEALSELCSVHSHVIPAEDYVRHRLAVNRAIAEVVGELKGSVLQSLASWRGLGCSLPSSQALLFWLREAMPERFEAVLARARTHHMQDRAAS